MTRIFVSYRRQDTGANAIGIGQYLENEFGKKNVYIDVDMQAGTKYPAVITKRLAECKVLLVLIGLEWLNSKDERGHPRLQKPDDWVRLEIAHALKQNITVIPVLINGAPLPDREALPDDIRGLLDHQVATVSTAGFRHEMAGLVRDIRLIRRRRPLRPFVGIASALLVLLAGVVLVQSFGFYDLLERIRGHTSAPISTAPVESGIWKSRPGEWILYGLDSDIQPAEYFLNANSVKKFGDRAVYIARFPLKSNTASSPEINSVQGAYEDNATVIDCTKSVFILAERTVYNARGERIFHFKSGEPESLDFSSGTSIASGSLLATAQQIVCDEKLRPLLTTKKDFDAMHLSYLANTPNGDGISLFGPSDTTSNSTYPIEALYVSRFFADHGSSDIFPGKKLRGPPLSFRILAQKVQVNCMEKKVLTPVTEYYDKDGFLVSLGVFPSAQPLDVKSGTIVESFVNATCGAATTSVAGNYEGVNNANYGKNGQGDQKISIVVEQNGTDLKVKFQSAGGGQGEGTGTLKDNRAESISLHSTVPGCPGSYEGSLSFTGNTMKWLYKGQDCGGAMEGQGTATRVIQ